MQAPRVTANAVQSVRDAFRFIDHAAPKIANPRGYGLSEQQWRRLAKRVDEVAHVLQPLMCSTTITKIDRVAKRARRAVAGGRMPARKAVR